MTVTNAVVGREATPPPPNVGTATLGEVLGLETQLTHYSGRFAVLALATPHGRRVLRDAGYRPYPAVPGLLGETLAGFTPRAFIVEHQALNAGVWAGCLTHVAPDLTEQLRTAIEAAHERNIPVYWVRAAADGAADTPVSDVPQGVLVVAPGSPLYSDVEEGAPASKLVSVLRSLAG